MSSLPTRISEALNKSLGQGSKPLHEPVFSRSAVDNITSCIESTYVSSVGEYVNRFEDMLCEVTGARHAVAVVNGTAALHVALLVSGVRPGDEVLLPTLTFVATANAISYCGAIPHFVDSEETTLGINVAKLDEYAQQFFESRDSVCVNKLTGRPVRAIVPMHVFGHPNKMNEIDKLADRLGVTVIEDAAEALGSLYFGKHVGTFGKLGTLSFNGNKIITTGGGGAVLTDDSDLAARIKHLTTTAKLPHPWEYLHDQIGYNYRMPNINAALGCSQIDQLETFLEKKRQLHEIYDRNFEDFDELYLFREPSNCRSNYWLQALVLSENSSTSIDEILYLTNERGFATRPVWRLIHELEPYSNCPKMNLGSSESLQRRIINIPSGVGLLGGCRE